MLAQTCANDGWSKAIAEAERQIIAAEDRIKGLRLSIQTFEEMRDKGEPWPGTFEEVMKADRKSA